MTRQLAAWHASLMIVCFALALFALMGTSISGATLVWACAKEINAPAYSGTSTSGANTRGFLGPAALVQPLVGLVLDVSSRGAAHSADDWRQGLAVLFVFALFGRVCTFMITETRCRNIYQERA